MSHTCLPKEYIDYRHETHTTSHTASWDAPLGQLKARITADRIAQLVAQRTLLLIVGQLQQIEARGRRGQPIQRVALANGEESPDDTADRVAGVLVIAHLHAAYRKGRLQMSETEQRWLGAAGHKLWIFRFIVWLHLH